MNTLKCFKSLLLPLLTPAICETTAKRTSVVLKRKFPMRLHKMDQQPKVFRSKDYVYDFVKYDDAEKKPNVDVILISYVEGLGKPGDQVSVRPFGGYEKLIAPGLAVYATPENIEKYSGLSSSVEATAYSSKYSIKTLKLLRNRIVGVPLSDTTPWTLQPWHMRVAFRANGFILPESAIQMPDREISGPSKDQHRKEFFVTVSISETERVKVRCRINLIGIFSDPVHQVDWIDPSEPLFEEDREVLDSMPKTSDLPYVEKIRIHFNR